MVFKTHKSGPYNKIGKKCQVYLCSNKFISNNGTTVDNYKGTLQMPIGSGFTSTSTTSDVIKGISLTGKTIIVTSGYAGIGLETVKTFLSVGASVIVPVRDINKAAKNLKGIEPVPIEPMDLMETVSINTFAEKFLHSHSTLPILVDNVGIMWVPLPRDRRGYESQLVTDHSGHFQLTQSFGQP